MDIDTTIRSATLSQAEAARMVGDIVAVEVDDGVTFAITRQSVAFQRVVDVHRCLQ